jgi:hypothetical protein
MLSAAFVASPPLFRRGDPLKAGLISLVWPVAIVTAPIAGEAEQSRLPNTN